MDYEDVTILWSGLFILQMKIVLLIAAIALLAELCAAQSGWEIRNPVVGLVSEPFVMGDNSGIDFKKQFRGAEPLPATKYDAREKHLANIRQLTFEGENAESYLSFDEKKLVFQSRGPQTGTCDQIYTMDLNGGYVKRISTGNGRTTCGYWFPDGERILFASTHESGKHCPPEPDRSSHGRG